MNKPSRLAITEFELKLHIGYYETFIELNEKSRFNPMYYLYYPAKASVISSKLQLMSYQASLKGLRNE